MIRRASIAALVMTAFAGGFAVGAYDLPPYPQARALKASLLGSDQPMKQDYELTHVPALSAERYERLDTKADIVMAGDSIIASGRWDELFPDVAIINRGANGDRIGGVLARVDQITRAQPRQVFIMIGINDVAARNTNDAILARYRQLVEALAADGRQVFVQSVIPCRITPYGPCDRQMQRQITALNPQLEALAKATGAVYVPVGEAMSGPDGVLEQYSPDGIHPGGAGFEKWRAILAPLMQPMARKEAVS